MQTDEKGKCIEGFDIYAVYVHGYTRTKMVLLKDDFATSYVTSQISALRRTGEQFTRAAPPMDGDGQVRVHISTDGNTKER